MRSSPGSSFKHFSCSGTHGGCILTLLHHCVRVCVSCEAEGPCLVLLPGHFGGEKALCHTPCMGARQKAQRLQNLRDDLFHSTSQKSKEMRRNAIIHCNGISPQRYGSSHALFPTLVVIFWLLGQSKIGMQNCKLSCDLNPPAGS